MPGRTDPALRCPHCHSASILIDESRCEACGTSFPAVDGIPVLVRNPESLAADIDAALRSNPAWYAQVQPPELSSPWRHHLRKRRLYVEQVLKRELALRGRAKALRFLDLGCGDGTNLPWLAPFAERLYASDYNMLRLTRAKNRNTGATLLLGDILDFPALDGAFDVVFFNHVIEHIPNDVGALKSVARILAPGGLVILGTPNEGAWWWQLAYRRAPQVRASTDHVHFYTADTIASKMTAAGLEVIEIEHIGWGPPDWHLDGRIRKYKIVDDAFEFIGRRLMPRQASSLYLVGIAPAETKH